MLNEDRVILMTKLAAYEARDGKKSIAIGKYFRSDYIGLQVLKSVICGTIVFAMVLLIIIGYDYQSFMENIYKTDLLAFGKKMGIIYLITIGLYALASYILAAYRYHRARQSLKTYYGNLKKLSKYYE